MKYDLRTKKQLEDLKDMRQASKYYQPPIRLIDNPSNTIWCLTQRRKE